ncbi:methyltransferase domain-containing protein [Streptomyces sp. ST2-7A]|uniref:class I SAM-dependent methyltransferase n=1 Tax=Streptomyces sp. ST2-7A TaxID=2907214 RepID=UPI001F1721D9|nr:methyltransferase domain-containing protein [Streptomyces sp. ST2-7A]MCE7081098.1 methyltransferase domain-containing protein [Streptomyces sp. ST2-7A]
MDTAAYKVEVAKAFNRAAADYDRLGVRFFTPMGRRLVELAAPGPGRRVLDIGCGRGASLFPAGELVGPKGRVTGIDVAESMIEEVRAEASRLGLRHIEALVMDGEDPNLPARSFDRILGGYSIIFMPDAPAALGRYAGLLADGGRIAFSSPVFTSGTFPFLPPLFTELIPGELLRSLPPQWQPAELSQRFNSWLERPEDLRATMEKAGFTEVEIIDEPVDMVAASGETWVDWSHTQGMRLLWQHLSTEDAAALRTRLITALDELRDGDGPLSIEVPVRYVRGTVRR